MANIYDKKNEEQLEKKRKAFDRKYEIEYKITNALNPFRVLAGISEMKDKARNKFDKKNKK